MGQRSVIKRTKRDVSRGSMPVLEVDVRRRRVPALPGVYFDGSRQAEILEAARRSIAAAVGVRADQIRVTPRKADP